MHVIDLSGERFAADCQDYSYAYAKETHALEPWTPVADLTKYDWIGSEACIRGQLDNLKELDL